MFDPDDTKNVENEYMDVVTGVSIDEADLVSPPIITAKDEIAVATQESTASVNEFAPALVFDEYTYRQVFARLFNAPVVAIPPANKAYTEFPAALPY